MVLYKGKSPDKRYQQRHLSTSGGITQTATRYLFFIGNILQWKLNKHSNTDTKCDGRATAHQRKYGLARFFFGRTGRVNRKKPLTSLEYNYHVAMIFVIYIPKLC